MVRAVGFPWLMRSVGFLNLLYCPLLIFTGHNAGIPVTTLVSNLIHIIYTDSEFHRSKHFGIWGQVFKNLHFWYLYKNILHHHHHYVELGHLLTRSGLTYPEVSSKVCHDSFCHLGNSVSLPWVIYYGAFYLHVVSSFSYILVICPKSYMESAKCVVKLKHGVLYNQK
jgi:hypothetical protein